MNINQASEITGISKKTLRFYEEKGLFSTERKGNSYRDYTNEDIDCILRIKALRSIGVSISDILLLQNNVISLREIINLRIKELEEDRINNEKQLAYCNEILNADDDWNSIISIFSDCAANSTDGDDQCAYDKNTPVTIGIDIGTSTISIAVIDDKHSLVDVFNIPNNSHVEGNSWESLQDPDVIYDNVISILNVICNNHPCILSIGVTGQMHGILYVDESGNSVTPLHTWLDKSCDQLVNGSAEVSYCDQIYNKIGIMIPTGYGVATHYYLENNNLLPDNAKKMCSIMDYTAMKLCGNTQPVMHPSVAASFGGYDLEHNAYSEKLKQIVNTDMLPEIRLDGCVVGYYNDSIPVMLPIGDSQSSYLGAIGNSENVLHINIGTGSQIVMMDECIGESSQFVDVRPYIDGKYLKCYAALCGGLAYSIVEKLIRSIVYEATGIDQPQYALMERLAERNLHNLDMPIIQTTFCGTRHKPDQKACIMDLTDSNFTPGNVVVATMRGMIRELYEHFSHISQIKPQRIVASGNAVRKNKILREIIAEYFGIQPELSVIPEEAAIGAALYSLKYIKK